MVKFIVLATALVALVVFNSPQVQKKGLLQGKGVRITIQGKKVPDGVYIRRLGEKSFKATVKNNVINVEGGAEVTVLLGFSQPAVSAPPCNESDSKSDTTDVDHDGVVYIYDACPCDSGAANIDPTRNGCPEGMSGTPPDTTALAIY